MSTPTKKVIRRLLVDPGSTEMWIVDVRSGRARRLETTEERTEAFEGTRALADFDMNADAPGWVLDPGPRTMLREEEATRHHIDVIGETVDEEE